MKKKKVEQQRGTSLREIRLDHRNRYQLAKEVLINHNLTSHVLDAGCGVGYGSFMLADSVKRVHAIDKEIEIVNIYEKSYNLPNIHFESADLMSAPFDTYDAVVCFELIEHVRDPATIIRRFSEATDSLIISTPNEELYPHLRSNGKPHPFHFRHYTSAQFEELLGVGGFKVKEWYCQKDHIDCDIVPGNDGKYMIAVATKE